MWKRQPAIPLRQPWEIMTLRGQLGTKDDFWTTQWQLRLPYCTLNLEGSLQYSIQDAQYMSTLHVLKCLTPCYSPLPPPPYTHTRTLFYFPKGECKSRDGGLPPSPSCNPHHAFPKMLQNDYRKVALLHEPSITLMSVWHVVCDPNWVAKPKPAFIWGIRPTQDYTRRMTSSTKDRESPNLQ